MTIIHHPDVRRMLMSMKAQTEAMRALAYTAAAALDGAKLHPDAWERGRQQALVDLLTPIVKGWCTEQSVEIATTGVQIHGGVGYVEETGAAQYLRDARITTIYEGTTGIQANDLIGRKVAFEQGATAKAVIAQMRAVAGELGGHPELAAIGVALAAGIDAVEEATGWLVTTYPKDAKAASASAVPYLKLFGIVAGGWQMARAALIAQSRLDAAQGDAKFYRAKLVTARFYADHLLPQAAALRHAVVSGADSVLALDPSQF